MKHKREDRRVPHSRCHGVNGNEWYETVIVAIKYLCDPDRRNKMGVAKLGPGSIRRCNDMNCNHLNHRLKYEEHQVARYVLVRDIAPVRPFNPDSEKERLICGGHPHLGGQYLCEGCARIGMAKRLIDVEREMILSAGGGRPPRQPAEVPGQRKQQGRVPAASR